MRNPENSVGAGPQPGAARALSPFCQINPASSFSSRRLVVIGFRAWTHLQDWPLRLRGRSDRLKAGFYVIVRIRFIATQRDLSAVQVLSGHVAGIDQRLMAIGQAPRRQLRDGLVAILIAPR